MDRIYSDDIYDSDEFTIEQVTDELVRRTQEAKESIDAYLNHSYWKDDLFIEEKDVMATSLSEDYIAKVTIETKTPEVAFAIEELLEGMWDD